MADESGSDSIAPDEVLYRRIPVSQNWFDPRSMKVDFAFRPTEADTSGLSLARAKYGTPEEEAARGRSGKEYWIATIAVGSIAQLGVKVIPRPEPNNPGHAEIVSLTFATRKNSDALELQKQLGDTVVGVLGPFPGMKAVAG